MNFLLLTINIQVHLQKNHLAMKSTKFLLQCPGQFAKRPKKLLMDALGNINKNMSCTSICDQQSIHLTVAYNNEPDFEIDLESQTMVRFRQNIVNVEWSCWTGIFQRIYNA